MQESEAVRIKKSSLKIVFQRSRYYRPLSMDRETITSLYDKDYSIVLNIKRLQPNAKRKLDSYLDGLEAYLNYSLRGSPREFQFARDGKLYKKKSNKEHKIELDNKVRIARNTEIKHKKSQSAATQREDVKIQTEVIQGKHHIRKHNKKVLVVKQNDHANWVWFENYLNDRTKERNNNKKYNEITFPYHSYLKHKRNESSDTYIQRTMIRDCSERVSTSAQKSIVKDLLNYSVNLNNLKEFSKPSTHRREFSNTTQQLTEKYKSFYNKFEANAQTSPKTSPKHYRQYVSPFHNYFAARCKKSIKARKHRQVEISVPEPLLETPKGKVYIGPENFPLSIYERSSINTYYRIW